ncbi:LPXTG cell wall anchor domain-containing protein, partial [Lactococcus sp. dk101]
ITGYTFTALKAGSAPTNGVITKDEKEVIYVYMKDPVSVTPVTPKTPSTSNSINNTVQLKTSSNGTKTSRGGSLPKTGDEFTVLSVLVGLSLIYLAGAVTLFALKKRKGIKKVNIK